MNDQLHLRLYHHYLLGLTETIPLAQFHCFPRSNWKEKIGKPDRKDIPLDTSYFNASVRTLTAIVSITHFLF